MRVPISKPFIGDEEANLAQEVISRGEISGTFGNYISEFEKGFAKYCGCNYGVSTANGTNALHLALATLSIGSGDEVLVSTFTNMAPFFAVLYQGAKPVPVDIESDTWNLDSRLLEEKITPRTKAIIAVHIYGHPVDMDPILEVAKKHNLFVIEDAAEAHGAEYKGKRIGSLGDIGCFSFYANKILTTGEGGMIVTNNREYAERAHSLKSLAYGDGDNRFMHKEVGFNYRMTNVQAAIGVVQLKKIDSVINKKREVAHFYLKHLENIPGLQLPVEKTYAKNVYWMFHVVLQRDLKNRREQVTEELKKRGIETRPAFIPYNMQEIFIKKGWTTRDECPVANKVAENGFYIPSGPAISAEELLYVVKSLGEVMQI